MESEEFQRLEAQINQIRADLEELEASPDDWRTELASNVPWLAFLVAAVLITLIQAVK